MYDWGYSESWPASVLDCLWVIRAGVFMLNGFDLPSTTGEEVGFWSRFKFAPDARLFVEDSHAGMVNICWQDKKPSRVVNFDAHHDCGYGAKKCELDCSNWGILYESAGYKLRICYPTWRTRKHAEWKHKPAVRANRGYALPRDYAHVFDTVFIASSGAWVPPWLDNLFDEFVRDCPLLAGTMPPARTFDYEAAKEQAIRQIELCEIGGGIKLPTGRKS